MFCRRAFGSVEQIFSVHIINVFYLMYLMHVSIFETSVCLSTLCFFLMDVLGDKQLF